MKGIEYMVWHLRAHLYQSSKLICHPNVAPLRLSALWSSISECKVFLEENAAAKHRAEPHSFDHLFK